MSTEPNVRSVNLFEWLADGMIRKLEEQPITVTVHLADGSIEMPIPPKHPWFKELNARKTEQLKRLRASFNPGDHKPSLKSKPKKESGVLVDRVAPDSVNQNDTNSRTTTK
jgi:hypothetical protein